MSSNHNPGHKAIPVNITKSAPQSLLFELKFIVSQHTAIVPIKYIGHVFCVPFSFTLTQFKEICVTYLAVLASTDLKIENYVQRLTMETAVTGSGQ